jgi:zinc D-Ala-D-Ala carboxypeptidase
LNGGVASTPRRIRIRKARVAGLLVVVAAIAALGYQSLASSSTAALPAAVLRGEPRAPADPEEANLDPDLREALRRATAEAAGYGVELRLESGWRSREHQSQLFREAVSRYGSEEEAARWVATADTSPHVSGDAVDIGPADALAWLSEHGADYGLCQIYGNEPWHYELRPEAIGHGCPPMYADPTHDPRMRGAD